MTTYILKTVLCTAILILIYYLFLEREKTYRFNRFYLLSGLNSAVKEKPSVAKAMEGEGGD